MWDADVTHLLLAALIAGALHARLALLPLLMVVVVAAARAAFGAGHAPLSLHGAASVARADGAGRAPGGRPAGAGNGRTVHAGRRGGGAILSAHARGESVRRPRRGDWEGPMENPGTCCCRGLIAQGTGAGVAKASFEFAEVSWRMKRRDRPTTEDKWAGVGVKGGRNGWRRKGAHMGRAFSVSHLESPGPYWWQLTGAGLGALAVAPTT